MAAFDEAKVPQVQDQSYFHISPKPAEKPNLQSGLGIAAKDIGEGIEQGASEINKGVEKYAESKGVELGEKVQGDYGAITEAAYNQTFPQNPIGVDTLTPGKSGAPPQIEEGLKKVQNIQAAYDQGSAPGHLRETQYLGDLYKQASALRAQWPGYRDYIDKGIEKATGITPNANSYIKSMMADINEMLTKKNGVDEKAMTHITTEAANGNPTAISAYSLIKAGKISVDEGLNRVGQSNIPKFTSEQAERNLKTTTAGTAMNKQIANDNIRQYVGSTATQFARDWLDHMGLTQDVLDKISTNQLSYEQLGVDPRVLDAALTRQEAIFRAQTEAWANKPHDYIDPVTGKPMPGVKQSWKISSGGDYEDIYKAGTQVFNSFHTALRDQDSGAIARTANMVKDINNKALWNTWNSPEGVAALFRATHVGKEMGGDQLVAAMVGRPDWPKDISVSSINGVIGSALSGAKTGGLDGIKETLATINKETHGETPMVARTYLMALGRLVGAPEVKDEGKLNVLHHLFDTKEQGWIGLIQEGSQSVTRHDMFNKFTNPDFVKNLTSLANAHNDPQTIKNYKDWVLKTFDSDLFNHDIADISSYETKQGVHIAWKTPPGRAPYFEAEPQGGQYSVKGTATQFYAQGRATDINRNLTKLNMGIGAVYNVYKDETPSILLREFMNRGINPNESQYLPAGLLNAIGASKAPVEGSTKAQDRVKQGEPTTPTAQPNASVQPPVVPLPQRGAEGTQSGPAPWSIEQSPGYQMGYQGIKRLGNVAGDAWQRYRKTFGFEK